MEAQFTVTIAGNWNEGDRPATIRTAERSLRRAVKDEFEYLAKRASVARADNRIYEIASCRAATIDHFNQLLSVAKKEPDAAWLIEQIEKTLDWHKGRMAKLPGKNPTL